jgi:ABC-2 type transport system ATP-binding protein
VPDCGGAKLLAAALREFDEANIELQDVGIRRPTLDDVFLSLTGHAAEVEEPDAKKKRKPTPEEVVSA